MNVSTLFVCFVCLLVNCCEAVEKPRKLALLVATTKGWPFYRQQSTLYSLYRQLVESGFDTKNIITMFYDDIANNPKNIDRPVVRDRPYGTNVYKDITKDYTGDNVNAKNFLAILEGNSTLATGPVFKPNRRDTLFLFITGYGAPQYLSFPSGPGLTAKKLMSALVHLRKQKKIKKVFTMIETAHSSQMFDGIIPRKDSIIGMSSTLMDELPTPLYCNYQQKICYGTEFGSSFIQRLEKMQTLKNGCKETIFDMFTHVRSMTTNSHVKLYGHLELGISLIQEFVSCKTNSPLNTTSNVMRQSNNQYSNAKAPGELSNDINEKWGSMSHAEQFEKFDVANSETESAGDNLKITMENLRKNRGVIKQTFKDIIENLKKMGYQNLNYDDSLNMVNILEEEKSDKYVAAIESFSSRCISVNKNPFVHDELWRFAYLVANNVSLEDLDLAMISACGEEHRNIENIH